MKKIVYSLLLVSGLLIASCNDGTSSKGNTVITGNVEGLNQGKLYLYQMQDTTLVAVDSLIVNGGNANFKFALDIESPEMLYLTLDRGHTVSQDNQLGFFAEPGQINIETNLKKFYAQAKVTGSTNQPIYEEYLKVRGSVIDKQNGLIVEMFNARKENNQHALDSLVNLDKRLNNRKYLNSINFAINHKNSDVAPFIALTDLYDANIKYLDTIYNSLDSNIANQKYGKQLKEFIAERKEMTTVQE
ncbi:DUF4369 domain-containing protein [Myroides albus]|uniref:DUF4369 domain-containing protein n=1 Tax=Myroides albus TaxID=2562892 RepID=A0A6I3LIU7_9FLAO|nr:DUF4369 domain-containing protein [Myroides albus]MTG97737.1 DUF4369 domain-containing protein [Myroides albus]UVD78714.1 DUF4369 domain-containing protein [Myroides albus]